MTFQPITTIASSHEALIGALDANDVAAIEAAVADLQAAVEALRQSGRPADAEAFRQQLPEAMALNQAARIRVNFLTDAGRRRIAAMAALRGTPSDLTYSRS